MMSDSERSEAKNSKQETSQRQRFEGQFRVRGKGLTDKLELEAKV